MSGAVSETSTSYVEISPDPLQLTKYTAWTTDPGAGAVATFSGITRNNWQGKEVVMLEYEAYVPMALKKLEVMRAETSTTLRGAPARLQATPAQ